jgi:hypothetical protein
VLEELGRDDEAELWYRRADVAAEALDTAAGVAALEFLVVEETGEPDDEDEGALETAPSSNEGVAISDDAPDDEPAATVEAAPAAPQEPLADGALFDETSFEDASADQDGQAASPDEDPR